MSETETPTLLLVEADIVVRHPLAEYLRACGVRVFEAATGEEARVALDAPEIAFDVVIADMQTPGSGFALRQWIGAHHPAVEVILAGSIETAVSSAAKVCAGGPGLAKPYEHHLVLERIRRMLARRPP